MNYSNFNRRSSSLLKKSCLSVLIALSLALTANARQAAQPTQYAIPAGDLAQVVNQISRSSGYQIVYDIESLRGMKSVEVSGSLTLGQALDKALSGSELTWVLVNPTTVSIKKKVPTPKSKKEKLPLGEASSTPPEVDKELERMIVVGSRLTTSPVETALPITVISREEIDRSGASSVAQVLNSLPEVSVSNAGDTSVGQVVGTLSGQDINATSVQIRGLPAGTTLVLINGRRTSASSSMLESGQLDLSTIPLALVDRVEVMPAGASAVYGGDGLAGVVNIVLRRDVSGYEFRVRKGVADDYSESQASLVWGKAWNSGSLTASASWQSNDALGAKDRSLTADRDLRPYGGLDYRVTYSNPGNVYSLAGCTAGEYCGIALSRRGFLPGLNSSFAGIPEGQNGTSLVPGSFGATAGLRNVDTPHRNLFSPAKSYVFSLNGNLEIGHGIEIFGDINHSRRAIPARELSLIISGGSLGIFHVGVNNPYNPFGTPVGIDYRFDDTGIFADFRQTTSRATLGARGKIQKWDWELSAWHSLDRSDIGGATTFSNDAIQAALNSSDPNTALNPFVGNGGSPADQRVLRSLIEPVDRDYVSKLLGYTGFVRGPLVQLPAGSAEALIGLEIQKQSLGIGFESESLAIDGSDISRAAFAEVRVPLLNRGNEQESNLVAMTGAMRRESSGRFEENAITKTIGMELRPNDAILFRSTYSTAFKPLVLYDASNPPLNFQSYVNDPAFGGEFVPVNAIYGGGVPDGLKPETSTSRTVGVVYTGTKDIRASLTAWDMELENRLVLLGEQAIVDNESFYPGRVTRDPSTGFITLLDAREVNVAFSKMRGIDVSVSGSIETSLGTWSPSLGASYVNRYQERRTPTSPVTDNLSVLRTTGWAPRWKIVPRLTWDFERKLYVTVNGRYVSDYLDPRVFGSGDRKGEYQHLGDFWLFDLNIEAPLSTFFDSSASYVSGTRFSLGARNLLNTLPKFCNSCTSSAYDASQYEIKGRTVYAEMRFSF